MNLAIIGSGYVGLVTSACFAETGNQVTCVDNDAARINRLQAGEIPIHEPGLDDLVRRNAAAGRLRFSTDLGSALDGVVAVFIAVGTPSGEDGAADVSQVLAVADEIGRVLAHDIVVVDKSTVPVGTAEQVGAAIQSKLAARGVVYAVTVVSNPEFLAEGVAINDFMHPHRVIIGTDSAPAAALMQTLYAPICPSPDRLMVMGVRDAEMTKYAANAMLATRVSFMNEIAAICERMGVDVEMVRRGLGADPRIGRLFLHPGAGYGGSCFPKDVRALINAAGRAGLEPLVLNAVEARNAAQKRILFEKLKAHFGDLRGKTLAMWGLAFKPGTDDLREAPSLVLVEALLQAGATVRAFDPAAQAEPAPGFTQVADQYAALEGADALVLVTEWPAFRQPDFARIKAALKQPVIVDGRNQYDPEALAAAGFDYLAVGRPAGRT